MNEEFKEKLDAVMARLLPFGTKEWVANLNQAIWDAGFRLPDKADVWRRISDENYQTIANERAQFLENWNAADSLAVVRGKEIDYYKERLRARNSDLSAATRLADEREKALKLAEEEIVAFAKERDAWLYENRILRNRLDRVAKELKT